MSCEQELCRNWSGDGDVCPCAIFDLERDVVCSCCNGDPNEVCDSCGDHECWAGRFMCENSATAGVTTRGRWEER